MVAREHAQIGHPQAHLETAFGRLVLGPADGRRTEVGAGDLMPGGGGQMFRSPDVALATVLQALAILVVAGALAGLIPARRAASINTVEALRTE